jgi:hypothetical protein
MASLLCISVWILNSDYSGSSNLAKIALVAPSLLGLFLNVPILILIAPIAWLTGGWLTSGWSEAVRIASFFATAWLSWFGLLFYCEGIARSGELILLRLSPPPPAHKS